MKLNYFLMLTSILVFSSSCEKDDPVTGNTITSVTVSNLPADPVVYDPVTGAPGPSTDKFTFFRFKDSSIVEHTDSASLKWDVGFKSSAIIVNSGVSGPGDAVAYIQNGLFSELKEIPVDSVLRKDLSFNDLAIGKKWSSYNGATMILSPIPGKTIVLRTASGNYVKMEILSFYKDAPASPNAFRDQARYYTFRYVHQSNGSKKFE
jgi:hypothetical protein